MTADEDLFDVLGPEVAEVLARESAIMTAATMPRCRGCGAEPTIELLGSEFDHLIVVEHADACPTANVEGSGYALP